MISTILKRGMLVGLLILALSYFWRSEVWAGLGSSLFWLCLLSLIAFKAFSWLARKA